MYLITIYSVNTKRDPKLRIRHAPLRTWRGAKPHAHVREEPVRDFTLSRSVRAWYLTISLSHHHQQQSFVPIVRVRVSSLNFVPPFWYVLDQEPLYTFHSNQAPPDALLWNHHLLLTTIKSYCNAPRKIENTLTWQKNVVFSTFIFIIMTKFYAGDYLLMQSFFIWG